MIQRLMQLGIKDAFRPAITKIVFLLSLLLRMILIGCLTTGLSLKGRRQDGPEDLEKDAGMRDKLGGPISSQLRPGSSL